MTTLQVHKNGILTQSLFDALNSESDVSNAVNLTNLNANDLKFWTAQGTNAFQRMQSWLDQVPSLNDSHILQANSIIAKANAPVSTLSVVSTVMAAPIPVSASTLTASPKLSTLTSTSQLSSVTIDYIFVGGLVVVGFLVRKYVF